MPRNYTSHLKPKNPIPQTEPLDAKQVQNNAGGFVYAVDDFTRLDRFLILGSDSPTYYQNARDLTRENAACVERCYAADPARTVAQIVDVSDKGRAPKNDPAIFALALGAVHKDQTVRALALAAMPKVCRTSTHLYQFVDAVRALGRGWGRSMKRAVANWYNEKSVEDVAFQAIKYRSREGYSHKRLLQTAHPAADSPERISLYRWMRGMQRSHSDVPLPVIARAHLAAMDPAASKDDIIRLARDHRLPWEALPTEANTDPRVWHAMLPHLGLTALIRNLGNMTRVGTIKPLSEAEQMVVDRLSNENDIRKSRVHPFAILQALKVYASGHGFRGDNSWTPSQRVVSALDGAFYKAFPNVVPTGKRHLIGIDVSHSMTERFGGGVMGCNEAAACLGLLTIKIEPRSHVMMFDHGLRDSHMAPGDTIEVATNRVSCINGGGTDCALPMLYAIDNGIETDAFVVITDNETWSGRRGHPMEALRRYRKETGIPAKLVVIGMTATEFTIADPEDGGALDVVGFDTAAPAVIADFIRG